MRGVEVRVFDAGSFEIFEILWGVDYLFLVGVWFGLENLQFFIICRFRFLFMKFWFFRFFFFLGVLR